MWGASGGAEGGTKGEIEIFWQESMFLDRDNNLGKKKTHGLDYVYINLKVVTNVWEDVIWIFSSV